MNQCPMRIAIAEGAIHLHETLLIKWFSEEPGKLCLITTSPHDQLPIRGRIRIFGIHLGTYHKRIRVLGNERYGLVVIHVYMSHRKPGKLFDLHFGEGYFLPGFRFEVPIVDEPAGKAVIGKSTSFLLGELKAVPGLMLADAKDLVECARKASRER